MTQNSPSGIRPSKNPDPELIPWKATGLTMEALKDLERRGIIRLLYINQRVIMIDRNDWRAMPERLAAERLTRATADAPLKHYNRIPGVAR